MIYTLFFNWIIPEDDILPEIGREEFKTKSIAEIFMDLIEKKPHLFNGDSWSPTKITIPMPIEWNFIKNNFDMVFQRLRTNIYQDAPVSWPTGNNPNEINSTGNSAIGNIKLENGQTVTNFDKQLEMKVDLANGKIDVSGQTEKLKNGDIHLDVDTAPLTDEEKNDFIAELNRLIADDDPLTKNTLTDTEKLKIKPLIENLKTADIYLFTGNNQESLFGFSHNGNLFLDESMLLSPLSFIHEMGESEIPLPPGFGELNRHTFLRGVGSKTREALIAIIAEGDTDLLRKMRDSSENFINEINTKRKTMGLGNIPAPEEALIRYNFATINNGERYPEMVESIGLEIFLFGLQDHMDPVMNAEFTAWIKTLTNSLNRGVHDIIVLRETDLMAQGLMGRLKRQARKGMLNIGRDLTIIVQKDGEELIVQKDGEEPSGTLVRAYAYADDVLTRESGKLPKIFLDLAYPASDNEILQTVSSDIRAFVENRNRADMTVIIDELIPNVPEGEAPRIDLGKLIVVASGLLDDKRRAKDFKMSARDMYENRKAMISAFQKSGILTLTDEYDAETAKGLEKILNDIGAGILRMRITRINWEEIADWFEANIEVMRSL
jgi:hypothetical protein